MLVRGTGQVKRGRAGRRSVGDNGCLSPSELCHSDAAALFDTILFVTELLQKALLVAIFLSLISHAQSEGCEAASKIPDGTPLATVVRELGRDDNDLERIAFLATRPTESARLLVRELHPVKGVRILGDEHYLPRWRRTEHVIWCLRALRGITGGLNFRAKTRHEFGDTEVESNREWFTGGEQYPKDATVHFFGVWMSR